MLKNEIREYQKEIINTIMMKVKENKREIFIEMATGTGKNTVIKEIIRKLNQEGNILILTKRKILEVQYIETFKDYKNIEISNYCNMENNKNFRYVILDETEYISEEEYRTIYQIFDSAVFIFFCNNFQKSKKGGNWLNKKEIDYSLTIQQVINDGYINPNQEDFKFEYFVEQLLSSLNFASIQKEVALKINRGALRIDFIADNDEKKIIVEVKSYRSEFVQNTIINQAVEQIEHYREKWKEVKREGTDAVLVVSCKVSDEIKENYYKERKILIIDISNLLYLSQENDELMRALIESVQYNIYHILPKPPLDLEIFQIQGKKEVSETVDNAINFIKKLENMNYGKEQGNDKRYEQLCVDIIKFLFETEFTKISEQNSTEDKMFRMDLVCGLKGASEFWKILIQHYNTRFVVFEFKNYEDEID